MDGLPQTGDGASGTPPEAIESEKLRELLKASTKDSKVIFGALRGVFDLNLNSIENFYHLVDQRVSEQNGATAILCEFTVYYNDGTSRKFPSIKSFQEYAETRKRHPTLGHL